MGDTNDSYKDGAQKTTNKSGRKRNNRRKTGANNQTQSKMQKGGIRGTPLPRAASLQRGPLRAACGSDSTVGDSEGRDRQAATPPLERESHAPRSEAFRAVPFTPRPSRVAVTRPESRVTTPSRSERPGFPFRLQPIWPPPTRSPNAPQPPRRACPMCAPRRARKRRRALRHRCPAPQTRRSPGSPADSARRGVA